MTAFEFGEMCAEAGDPFCPETVFVSAGQKMDMYAQGFLSVKPGNQDALAFIGISEPFAELRARDLAVDAAQSRPDEFTAAQRNAAWVVNRPQLREDDGEIIFAF